MMKLGVVAALAMSLVAAAQAAPSQSCIRPGQGVDRVVAKVESPADCCNGRMQCSQFLSTTVVARPSQPERT